LRASSKQVTVALASATVDESRKARMDGRQPTMFPQMSPGSAWIARRSTPAKSTRHTTRRRRALAGLAAFAMALGAPMSASADWPERQVKLIVTFPPGSASDAAARIFADALGKKWGKPVVVEDRPGAEGTIGVSSFVASQDDHALLYTVAGSITVAPMLVEKLPYDVNRDLVPISATTEIVLTLTVSNQLSVSSIPELIAALRSNPGKYAWTSGPTLPRYVFSAFLKQHDLNMSFVSYRDASQPQADLGEGRIQALLTSLTASSSPVQAGKARFLAVVNPSRAATLPDVKTARELGYPELEIEGLAGVFGSKIMPEAVRNRIAADVAAICRDTDIRRKLEVGGHNVLSGTTEELKSGIEKQRSAVSELAKIIDIRNPQ
jgi:tripartite-type tricarboxylate transporter receptor subunit TctC